jgi:hypothetical protein
VTTWTSSWHGIDGATIVPLPAETTAVLCCPSGYTTGPWANACASAMQQDTRVTYFQPFSSNGVYYPGSVTVGDFAKGEVVVGDGVPIWYQASDSKVLAAATQTVAPTSSPATPQSNATTRPTDSFASNSPTSISSASNIAVPNSSSGLSTGAKVGLGVAIPLAIVLGLVLGWFLFRRRKAKTHSSSAKEMEYYGAYTPEDAALKTYYAHAHELEQPVQELPGQPGLAHELPAGSERVQPAGTRGPR